MAENSGMRATFGGDFVKLNTDIKNVSENGAKALFKVLVSGANKIRNRAILSMRNTERASWSYKRGSKIHRPSAPGSPPAIDSGDLIKALVTDVRGNKEVEFGATTAAPYGAMLEKGTKKFAARPWLEPATDEELDGIKSEADAVIRGMFK